MCAAIVLSATGAAAQSRDVLAARIDSLLVAYELRLSEFRTLDSLRNARERQIRLDTVAVGPFLIVDRDSVNVTKVAAAMERAWQTYAPIAGDAADRISGAIVTLTLDPDHFGAVVSRRVSRFEPLATGRADFPLAAEWVITRALTAALPADLRDWLAGSTLRAGYGLESVYRELAVARAGSPRNCFHEHADACVDALGLGSAGDPHVVSGFARATLLAHALEVGGRGAYERLFDDASDAPTRLEHAAQRPVADVVAGWRSAVQDARPDVHAGVARAGAWALVWLAALALLAMRSTRWRFG